MSKNNKQLHLRQPFKFYDEYIGKLKWWQKLIIRFDALFHRGKLFIVPSDDVKEIKKINFRNGSTIMIIPKDKINESTRGLRSKIKGIHIL